MQLFQDQAQVTKSAIGSCGKQDQSKSPDPASEERGALAWSTRRALLCLRERWGARPGGGAGSLVSTASVWVKEGTERNNEVGSKGNFKDVQLLLWARTQQERQEERIYSGWHLGNQV